MGASNFALLILVVLIHPTINIQTQALSLTNRAYWRQYPTASVNTNNPLSQTVMIELFRLEGATLRQQVSQEIDISPFSVIIFGKPYSKLFVHSSSYISFGKNLTNALDYPTAQHYPLMFIRSHKFLAYTRLLAFQSSQGITLQYQGSMGSKSSSVQTSGTVPTSNIDLFWSTHFRYTSYSSFEVTIFKQTKSNLDSLSMVCFRGGCTTLDLPSSISDPLNYSSSLYLGCGLNCLTCSAVDSCEKCISFTFDLVNGTCIESCSYGCQTCTNSKSCSQCVNGFFLNDAKLCDRCMPQCLTCTSAGSCQNCVSGFYLQNQMCQPCPVNCKTCSQGHICYCQDGLIFSTLTGTCVESIFSMDKYIILGCLAGILILMVIALLMHLVWRRCKLKKSSAHKCHSEPSEEHRDLFRDHPEKLSQACPICLQSQTNLQTTCGHLFHQTCLVEWFSSSFKLSCPSCRAQNVQLELRCTSCNRFHVVIQACQEGCPESNHYSCFQQAAKGLQKCNQCKNSPKMAKQHIETDNQRKLGMEIQADLPLETAQRLM